MYILLVLKYFKVIFVFFFFVNIFKSRKVEIGFDGLLEYIVMNYLYILYIKKEEND